MKRFFRPDEAAEFLSCSKRTIYRLIQDGELLAFSLRDRGAIRIPAEAVEKFIQRRRELFELENGVPNDDI